MMRAFIICYSISTELSLCSSQEPKLIYGRPFKTLVIAQTELTSQMNICLYLPVFSIL